MALTVGTDTYISATDTETYLTTHYFLTDAKYVAWAALTAGNKDILLRKAAQTIDRQPLAGYKYSSAQTMAFPRYTYSDGTGASDNLHPLLQYNGFYSDGTVPAAVKHAQCEIAIELAQGSNARADMQRQGVKSFSLGNLSESYTGAQNSVVSFEAKQLLAPFTGGGFRI